MSAPQLEAIGPDLTLGLATDTLADGKMLAGHVGEDAVLLARRGNEFFAIGATCTHYNGPLSEGLMVHDTVRCPWHHACFSLRTGEAVRAPALSPVACWLTEVRGDKVFVREKAAPTPSSRVAPAPGSPQKIVVIGGGAAGFAAAEMLRRQRFQGGIVMLSDDNAPPVDRPNLSKDYLAGRAPEEWIPLRGDNFYTEQGIDLRLQTAVTNIDVRARAVVLDDGSKVDYDRLLLATGAEPVRLPLPGMDLPHVHALRTLGDCRAIIARAATARHAVVMGASFIGLEVAASLRARGIEVHVVAPEKRPMERVLGPDGGLRAPPARRARSDLPPGGRGDGDHHAPSHTEERRHDRCGFGRRRCRRAAATGAGRERRPCDRPWRNGQRISGDQRTRNLRSG